MASGRIDLKKYFNNGFALVIDDAAGMRRTLRAMLRQLGVGEVVVADDGDTALESLGSMNSCCFVLVDWNMPRVPGINVVRELRADANFQDVPILMVTAEDGRDQVAEAAEAGVDGYIVKPFGLKTLEDKLSGIISARENPPEHVMLIKDGRELMMNGEYKPALELFQMAVSMRESARAYVAIGDVYDAWDDFDKALEYYDAGAFFNPMYLQAYVKSANLRLRRGDKRGALAMLSKAAEIGPSNPDRHIAIGKIQLDLGDETRALESFLNAVKQGAQKAEEIAEFLFEAGKIEIAVRYFRAALNRGAGNAYVHNRLGMALRRLGNWKDAVQEYRIALKIAPDDAAIYYNIGKAYAEGGLIEPAEEAFVKALELNPALREAEAALKEINGHAYWDVPAKIPATNYFHFPNWLAAPLG